MKRILTITCLTILLCACAVKLPSVATYVLTVPVLPIHPGIPKTHKVLLVSNMVANPGYKTEKMIYVTSPGHLGEFTRHKWVAPPAQMLTPLIVQRIEAKNYFHAVIMPPFEGNSDFRLETRLLVFQQEFIQSTSQVRCVIQAVLINSKTNKVLRSGQFQTVVASSANNPQGGVLAANQAAEQISEQIAQFVVTASLF